MQNLFLLFIFLLDVVVDMRKLVVPLISVHWLVLFFYVYRFFEPNRLECSILFLSTFRCFLRHLYFSFYYQ